MARRKKRKKLSFIAKLILLIICCLMAFFCYKKYQEYVAYLERIEAEKIANIKKEKYNKCLDKKVEETDVTSDIETIQSELNAILKKYNVAVYYEDINSGFDYKYNEDEVIYGASLIKLVDALYLYDNDIDLNTTKIYEAKYIKNSSKGMDSRKVGEAVSLNDLMKYALSVSDNTAHFMLLDYIGFNNLKSYGKILGATAILSGGDNYGNQTATDTNIYLKRAYKIMTDSKYNYGDLLKEYMSNDYQNHLLLENESDIAHKYGSYSNYFHDIGIVFDENPYTISVLTQHGKGKYKEIINLIHEKINELHLKFRTNRAENCYKEVYGSEVVK